MLQDKNLRLSRSPARRVAGRVAWVPWYVQCKTACPLYPPKQTCALQNLMSALPPIATAKADIKGETLDRSRYPSATCRFHRYVWRRSLTASRTKVVAMEQAAFMPAMKFPDTFETPPTR